MAELEASIQVQEASMEVVKASLKQGGSHHGSGGRNGAKIPWASMYFGRKSSKCLH